MEARLSKAKQGILIPMVVDICKGHKSPLTGGSET